jgi:hypothetical protein
MGRGAFSPLSVEAPNEKVEMGYAHILWIYNDALQSGRSDVARLKAAVGEAICELCTPPERFETPRRWRQKDWAPIECNGNAAHHAAILHSSDRGLFIWIGNGLRDIKRLDREDLQVAKLLLDEELATRTKRDAGEEARRMS